MSHSENTNFSTRAFYPLGIHKNLAQQVILEYKKLLADWAFAAMADGWTSTPMSPGSNKLTKGEFVAHVNIRHDYMGIDVWSAHGLAAINKVPAVYNMEALIAQTKVCHFCDKPSDKLQRVGFANRACLACADAARRRIEVPGWYD